MRLTAALRSAALKTSVMCAIAYHSFRGYFVGKRSGQDALLDYLSSHYLPHVLRILHFYGISVTIEGDTDVLKDGALILAWHESMIDTIIAHHPRLGGRPAYLAKESLFKIPFFGACMRMAGMIPVKKGRLGADIIKLVAQRLQEGRTVVVFVEGTRTPPPHHRVMPGTRLFISQAEKLGKPVLYAYFGEWHKIWGPKGTILTASVGQVAVKIEPHDFPEA